MPWNLASKFCQPSRGSTEKRWVVVTFSKKTWSIAFVLSNGCCFLLSWRYDNDVWADNLKRGGKNCRVGLLRNFFVLAFLFFTCLEALEQKWEWSGASGYYSVLTRDQFQINTAERWCLSMYKIFPWLWKRNSAMKFMLLFGLKFDHFQRYSPIWAYLLNFHNWRIQQSWRAHEMS